MRIPLCDATLEGVLDLPDGVALRDTDAVLVCHPHPAFGGRMSTPIVADLAAAFVAAGLPGLRFHFRGIEGSGGTATGGLVEEADVLAATRYLVEEGAARVAWVGYSFGALMCLKAVAAGARPPVYVGIALPATLVGDDPARVVDVARAMGAGVQTLLVSGAEDPLCDAERLRAWRGEAGAVVIETLPGEAHGFSITGARRVVARTVDFVRAGLAA